MKSRFANKIINYHTTLAHALLQILTFLCWRGHQINKKSPLLSYGVLWDDKEIVGYLLF